MLGVGEGGRVTEQTVSGIHPGCMMAGTTPVPVRNKNTIIQQHQSKQQIFNQFQVKINIYNYKKDSILNSIK